MPCIRLVLEASLNDLAYMVEDPDVAAALAADKSAREFEFESLGK